MNADSAIQRQIEQISEHLATLVHHVAEVRSSNRDLSRRFIGLEQSVAGLRADLKADMDALRSSLTADMQALHSDVSTDMEALRSSLTADMQALRSDVSADIQALRIDFSGNLEGLRAEMKSENALLRQDMAAGFTRVDGRLDYLSQKIEHYVSVSARGNMETRSRMEEYGFEQKAELTKLETRLLRAEDRLDHVEAAIVPGNR